MTDFTLYATLGSWLNVLLGSNGFGDCKETAQGFTLPGPSPARKFFAPGLQHGKMD